MVDLTKPEENPNSAFRQAVDGNQENITKAAFPQLEGMFDRMSDETKRDDEQQQLRDAGMQPAATSEQSFFSDISLRLKSIDEYQPVMLAESVEQTKLLQKIYDRGNLGGGGGGGLMGALGGAAGGVAAGVAGAGLMALLPEVLPFIAAVVAAGAVTAAVSYAVTHPKETADFAGRNLPQNQPEKKHNEKTVAMDDEIAKLQQKKDALDADIASGEAAGQDISGQLSAAEDLKKEIEAKEKARDAELAKIPDVTKTPDAVIADQIPSQQTPSSTSGQDGTKYYQPGQAPVALVGRGGPSAQEADEGRYGIPKGTLGHNIVGSPGGGHQADVGPGTRVHGSLAKNQQLAYDAAKESGLDHTAARLLVGNLSGESLSNEHAYNPDYNAAGQFVHMAQGIVQWDPTRSEAIKNHFGMYPKDMTVGQQTKAAIWEMKTNPAYRKAWDALNNKNLTDEERITAVIKNYERPAHPEIEAQKRLRLAKGAVLSDKPGERPDAEVASTPGKPESAVAQIPSKDGSKTSVPQIQRASPSSSVVFGSGATPQVSHEEPSLAITRDRDAAYDRDYEKYSEEKREFNRGHAFNTLTIPPIDKLENQREAARAHALSQMKPNPTIASAYGGLANKDALVATDFDHPTLAPKLKEIGNHMYRSALAADKAKNTPPAAQTGKEFGSVDNKAFPAANPYGSLSPKKNEPGDVSPPDMRLTKLFGKIDSAGGYGGF